MFFFTLLIPHEIYFKKNHKSSWQKLYWWVTSSIVALLEKSKAIKISDIQIIQLEFFGLPNGFLHGESLFPCQALHADRDKIYYVKAVSQWP